MSGQLTGVIGNRPGKNLQTMVSAPYYEQERYMSLSLLERYRCLTYMLNLLGGHSSILKGNILLIISNKFLLLKDKYGTHTYYSGKCLGFL